MYRAIAQTDNFEAKAFWLSLVLLAGLAVAYVCLIQGIVFNVVARKTAFEQTINLSAEISTLEGRYVAALSELTMDRAYQLGFIDAGTNESFAYVGGLGAVSMR